MVTQEGVVVAQQREVDGVVQVSDEQVLVLRDHLHTHKRTKHEKCVHFK